MKVLKPGRNQQGWSTNQVCTGDPKHGGGCGAELLIEQPDLFKTVVEDHENLVAFKCCECGVETAFAKTGETPFYVASTLPSRKDWLDRQTHK